MFKFFAKSKYDIYSKTISEQGAGDDINWSIRDTINCYIEPADGENLKGCPEGLAKDISLTLYTQQPINVGERLHLFSPENSVDEWFEIVNRSFYKMPFFNYFKGYLVKTDENISI
jgi:hypothetical protein